MPSAPLTVIVPTLNAADTLPATFDALLEGVWEGLVREVLVSDGGSDDSTFKLIEAVGAEWIAGASGRGAQLKRGVDAARTPWVLLLHADTVLQPVWTEAVRQAMTNRDFAYHFRLDFDAKGLMPMIVAGWANWRARVLRLPYGDQGLLIHCDLLDQVGGMPDLPLMEDVALARALRGRLRQLPVLATTSAEKFKRQGWIRRGARNLTLLIRYFAGADPSLLAQSYRKT
jgi:rSAM/selenodomain-associated transferase 2